MSSKTLIIPVKQNHYKLISRLEADTFREAFSQSNSKEDIDLYISEKFSEKNILNEINREDTSFFLSYTENKISGYIKLVKSPNPENLTHLKSIELQRIYVLSEFYGNGTGHSLMQFAIDTSLSEGFEAMWLGVWKLNHRAIRFYEKWNFEIFSSRKFRIGKSLKDDWLMFRRLK